MLGQTENVDKPIYLIHVVARDNVEFIRIPLLASHGYSGGQFFGKEKDSEVFFLSVLCVNAFGVLHSSAI